MRKKEETQQICKPFFLLSLTLRCFKHKLKPITLCSLTLSCMQNCIPFKHSEKKFPHFYGCLFFLKFPWLNISNRLAKKNCITCMKRPTNRPTESKFNNKWSYYIFMHLIVVGFCFYRIFFESYIESYIAHNSFYIKYNRLKNGSFWAHVIYRLFLYKI